MSSNGPCLRSDKHLCSRLHYWSWCFFVPDQTCQSSLWWKVLSNTVHHNLPVMNRALLWKYFLPTKEMCRLRAQSGVDFALIAHLSSERPVACHFRYHLKLVLLFSVWQDNFLGNTSVWAALIPFHDSCSLSKCPLELISNYKWEDNLRASSLESVCIAGGFQMISLIQWMCLESYWNANTHTIKKKVTVTFKLFKSFESKKISQCVLTQRGQGQQDFMHSPERTSVNTMLLMNTDMHQ